MSSVSTLTWAASTTDQRALQKMNLNDRIAARWESSSFFTVDVNFTDGQTHPVALYSVDWDGSTRIQRVDVLDGATNALLDSRTISSFNGGQYLVWNIRGWVKLLVNKVGAKTAVVSGIYFGGPLQTSAFPPCSLSLSASALTIPTNGSAGISAQLLNFTGSGTISGNSSARIQLSPATKDVYGSNAVNFTIDVKNKSGTVNFSSPCGSQTIPITVR